jgi:hypothetical protein
MGRNMSRSHQAPWRRSSVALGCRLSPFLPCPEGASGDRAIRLSIIFIQTTCSLLPWSASWRVECIKPSAWVHADETLIFRCQLPAGVGSDCSSRLSEDFVDFTKHPMVQE